MKDYIICKAAAENVQNAVSDNFTINGLYLMASLSGLKVRII